MDKREIEIVPEGVLLEERKRLTASVIDDAEEHLEWISDWLVMLIDEVLALRKEHKDVDSVPD